MLRPTPASAWQIGRKPSGYRALWGSIRGPRIWLLLLLQLSRPGSCPQVCKGFRAPIHIPCCALPHFVIHLLPTNLAACAAGDLPLLLVSSGPSRVLCPAHPPCAEILCSICLHISLLQIFPPGWCPQVPQGLCSPFTHTSSLCPCLGLAYVPLNSSLPVRLCL